MRKKAALFASLLLLAVSATPAFAVHMQDVLGDETASRNVNFPPVAAGPGYFLPDSPLYIVDKTFQDLRLMFAFTPERRVEVHNLILGERLAELRVMAQRNNRAAMQATLAEIANESEKVSTDLADAAAQGTNVGTLAKNTNDLMKLQREILKTVAEQADSALALQIESTRQAMLVAKVRVEDQLTEEEMLEAMENDLEDEVDTQVLAAETRVEKVDKRLNQLERLLEKTERKQARQEIKERIKVLREERKKRQREAREQAKKTIEALKRLKDSRKAEKEGKNSLLPDQECDPSLAWINHGAYVSCVARQKQNGQNVSDAARSNVGKKKTTTTATPSPSPSPSPSPTE